MKIDLICRVCLKEGEMQSIFDSYEIENDKPVYCWEMLNFCTSTKVSPSDGFPSQICRHCFAKLWSAYKLRRLCETSYEYLTHYILENKHTVENIKTEANDDCCPVTNFVTGTIEIKELQNNDDKEELDLQDTYVVDQCDADDVANVELYNETHNYDEQNENMKDEISQAAKINSAKKSTNKDLRTKKEMLKCEHCSKTFKFKYRLLIHEETHIGLKKYFCDICQKAYRSERDHINMHKRGSKFKCDICSKCFNAKSRLAYHIVIHNTNRVGLPCGVNGCTRTFVTTAGLQLHRSQHDGVKKDFVCHVCSYTCAYKYSLDAHLRKHSNEKKFQCSKCEKKFLYASSRKSHEIRYHTNVRNYPCLSCDKSFHTSDTLKRHMLSHTKILNEKCRFCTKCFARRDNRKRHEMVMHGVSGEDKNDLSIFK